ncbi:nucleoside hydrolase [Aquipuribacter nitratireducens]|uniref:Nucleoside hydrolase n=1 Tax=Aquipuribacter nitratireducens TaxID=650104 RepID=A0ABW0GJQ9_9MICO
MTCVGGNTDLPDVLANTTAVLAAAGADLPVHAGLAHPGGGPAVEVGERWQGADGLMGCRPAPDASRGRPPLAVVEERATDALARLAVEGGLTLVPLGPQSTVADLARAHEAAFARLGRIHFMGGSGSGGNVTPAAEFNVHHDPAAADTVLRTAGRCGVPVTMYGLEVFGRVRVPPDRVRALSEAAHPALRLAGRLLLAAAAKEGAPDATIGDAGAVAALARPDLVTVRRRPVAVQVDGGPARGQTVVDRRASGPPAGEGWTDVDVVEDVDGAALAAWFVDTLEAFFG